MLLLFHFCKNKNIAPKASRTHKQNAKKILKMPTGKIYHKSIPLTKSTLVLTIACCIITTVQSWDKIHFDSTIITQQQAHAQYHWKVSSSCEPKILRLTASDATHTYLKFDHYLGPCSMIIFDVANKTDFQRFRPLPNPAREIIEYDMTKIFRRTLGWQSLPASFGAIIKRERCNDTA